MAASYANVVQTYLSRKSKPPDVQDPNDDEIDNPNTAKPKALAFKGRNSVSLFARVFNQSKVAK
jgi:hypothetical protein